MTRRHCGEAVAPDPEDGREIEDGQDLAANVPDAQDGDVRPRHRRHRAELGDLDHVLDRDRVGLPDPGGTRT